MKRLTTPLLVAALFGLSVLPQAARAVPRTLSLQGYLTTDAGAPRDGDFTLTVSLWTAETGGTQLFTETLVGVDVARGLFDLALGADVLSPLSPDTFRDAAAVWMQVALEAGPGVAADEPPLPRRPLTSAPFAFAAHHAVTAATASDLACASGCVAITELAFDPATQAELNAALVPLVTQSALATTLANYVTSSGLTAALASYVTSGSLATTLASYVTSAGLTTTLGTYARKADLPTSVDGLGGGSVTGAVRAPSFLQAGQAVCDASGNCGRTVDDFNCGEGQAPVFRDGLWGCAAVVAAPPSCTGAFRALQFNGATWSCVDLRVSGLSGGKARGFEVIDAWGFAWDGQMRPASTWANASAACVADGGRLPTVTELTRVSHGAGGTGEVSTGLETNWHWAITPLYTGSRYMAVRLDTGVNSASGNAAELQRYRCVWPNRTSSSFNGNKCHGPPGAECFASTAEGGRYNVDKLNRPAVPWWVAVNECAFYNARVARAVTYAELIQAGLPNGAAPDGWIWTSDRAGYNGTNFLFTLVRWTGVQTAFDGSHDAFVTWNYNAEGHNNAFRCVGLRDDLGTYAGAVTNEFVDVGRTRLKSTTSETALQSWVTTLDGCLAQGGHIPTMADWVALVQAGLPRPALSEYSHTSDAEYGTSGGSTQYNAIVRWTGVDPTFNAVHAPYSNWGSRSNAYRGRCVWYPLDPTYNGPSEATCNGGCFVRTVQANGQTHRFWVDRFDRTPAKVGDAIRTCHQNGGHLLSHAEWAEMIRSGLPNGSNTNVWTSDWARYEYIFTVRWTGVATGWDNLAGSDIVPTTPTTTGPYRCLWSNELNE